MSENDEKKVEAQEAGATPAAKRTDKRKRLGITLGCVVAVLVVAGAEKRENPLCALTEKEHILHYMRAGYEKKEAVKMAAKDRGVTKSELYPFSVDLSL